MPPSNMRGTAGGPVHRSPRAGGPRHTIVDKIWRAHLVDRHRDASGLEVPGSAEALQVDRIYLHERQLGLLAELGRHGLEIGSGSHLVACADQQVPTSVRLDTTGDAGRDAQTLAALERLESSSELLDVPVFAPGDHRGGVLNVVGPEQGMTVPGALVVGTDAHMSTHGAFGAVALAFGDDELAEVVATGTIRRAAPDVLRVTVMGRLDDTSDAKDLALWLLRHLGPGAARGALLELRGGTINALSMDGRMTVCNMAVESGAVSAIVEPDDVTLDYLAGRPFAPVLHQWTTEAQRWLTLRSDPGAEVAAEVVLQASGVGPQVTWGTHAWQSADLDGVVPAPGSVEPSRRDADAAALREQDLVPGTPLREVPVDQVFIGSCTNARLVDIRAAAEMLHGEGRVRVPTWVVPGSHTVARQAEAEGLHEVFRAAGVEWRAPGCSLCVGVNGDAVAPGTRLASTANRPERGRVGPGARVHVLGPAAAAATALTGRLTDPRELR